MNKKKNTNKKTNNKSKKINNLTHFKLPFLIVGITLIVGIAIGVGIMFFTNNTNLSDTNFNASITSPYAGKTPYNSKLNSISVTCTKTSSNKAILSCKRYYTDLYKTKSIFTGKNDTWGNSYYACPAGFDYVNSRFTKKYKKPSTAHIDCYGKSNPVLVDGCSYGIESTSASISGNTLTLNKNTSATVKVKATYTTKYGNTKTASCSVTLTPAASTNTTNNSGTSKNTSNNKSKNKSKNTTTKNYKFYYTDPNSTIQKGSSTNITSSTAIVCSANNSNVTITAISNGCKITGKKVGTSTIKIANKNHQATYYTEKISIIKKNTTTNTTTVVNQTSSSKQVSSSKKATSSKNVKPTSITIKDTDRMVEVGKSKKINYTIKPTNATNKNVSFKSNNTKIVTVDSKGNFTGKKVGKAKITVTAKGKTSVKKVVNVEVINKKATSSNVASSKATTAVASTTSGITVNSTTTKPATTTDKSDTAISAITVKNASTGASFDVSKSGNTYSATVANGVTKVKVNVVTKNPKSTITKPAGLKKDKVVTWNVEAGKTKTETINVKSENGKKNKDYTIKIKRAAKPTTKSSDATLKSFTIYQTSGYDNTTKTGTTIKTIWDKTFNKNTTSYNIILPSGTKKFEIVAYPTNKGAVITSPSGMVNNQAEHTITNSKKIAITVKAENGATKTYTFNISIQGTAAATAASSITNVPKIAQSTDYTNDFSLSIKYPNNNRIQYTIGMKNTNLKSWIWSTNNKDNGKNYTLFNQGTRTSSTPTLDKTSYNRVGRITKYYTNGNIKEWIVMPNYNSKTNAIYNEFSIELVSITDTLATYKIKIADPSKISKWIWYTNNKNNGKEYTTYAQGTSAESTPLLQKAAYERIGRIEIYYKTGEIRRYSVKPNYNTKTNTTVDGFAVITQTTTPTPSSSAPIVQKPATDYTELIEKEKNTVKKIIVNNEEIKINKGRSTEVVAIVLPGTVTNREVTWETADESIATVDENGMIYGVNVGTTTLKITSKASGNSQKTINVTITEPTTSEALSKGEKEQLYDINKDGIVNITDYSIISYIYLNSPKYLNNEKYSEWKEQLDLINPAGIDLNDVSSVGQYILYKK